MAVSNKPNKSKKNLEDIYPLTPMQEGMLFHTLYSPESGLYCEQLSFTFCGDLSKQAFKHAWQRIVERHPVFRTLVVWKNRNKPLQVVLKSIDIPWKKYDWRSLSKAEQQKQIEDFLQADRNQGFELEKAPLMRFAIIQLANETYRFVWSHHHLLMDGWCLPIIFKEVLAFYEAFRHGKDLHLPNPRPYRDYIVWLQQQDISKAEIFWRQQLQGFTAPTPLVVDRSIANKLNQKEIYDEQHFQLSKESTVDLQSLARKHRLTLNTLVQGAWALLLNRYSRESDIVFGATVSGRPPALKGVESMVGLFINTLPVRVQVSEKAELLPWLQQLQAQQVERQQYYYSPLVEIQQWSEVPRGLPLFNSIVVFENYPVDASLQESNSSLQISNISSFETTNYPLTLVALPKEELKVGIKYNTSRFESSSISIMLGHLRTLLEGILENPQRRVADLPILTSTEEHQLLVEWNDTQADYPQDRCIHQLFEEQVERTPKAIAVIFEDQQLTYRELNSRANQLAHYLQSLGLNPEVLVGICVERSIKMVVGLLAILKAGGAYVPIDPAYPQERIAYMLNDSAVSVLLTTEDLAATLPKSQAHLICLDKDWSIISHNSQTNCSSRVEEENLAYMIYTSGSTGKPKGAMNTHQGIRNRLLWMQDAYQINAADKVLQKTPFSFDVSVWEFFWPLITGACLIVAKPGGHKDSAYLVKLITEQQITTLHFVPSMLQVFVEEQGLEKCLCLKRVICSGEALPVDLQTRFFERLECQLHNLYGPTEAAVDVTFWECQPDKNLISVPIGRPIANTQIYILNSELQPVPIGVPGELHIGGIGLARGYFNRPELTKKKFISNPFSQEEEARLYKTGDLARYLPDGNLEYLGRIDHQVKIRGFRIELGEIESVLAQHPQVRETVIIAREDQPGNKQLVAYLVGHQDSLVASCLRNYLKEKLPDYMIPSAFVQLESLPLTPNGKVDRRALPAPDRADRTLESSFVPPRNLLEQQLVQIWEDVLSISTIGVQDNFFDLGGHSLLAVRLMAQIQQQFGKNLPLATIFQTPTIEQLASLLLEQTDSMSWSSLVAIQPHGSKQPFFCVPGIGGNLIYFYNLARHLKDQPFYGLQAVGLDGKSKPHNKIEDMATHYIEVLQAVQPQGPYLLGGHSFGGQVAFEMAQQLQKQGQEITLLAIMDAIAPVPDNKKLIGFDWDDAMWLTKLVGYIERWLGHNLNVSYEALQLLTLEEQLNHLKQQFQILNLLPPKAGTEQMRGLLQVFKANLQTHYVPQDIYPTTITLFRAKEAYPEDAESDNCAEILQSPTWGWEKFSPEPVELHFVPGNHMTMLSEPHVQELAKHLIICFEQVSVIA